ncbi:glycosyl transferase family protein [Pseudomonas aeruginosa]|nr:glycosyl transferase family protein [Pseudomonas aeruginosa]
MMIEPSLASKLEAPCLLSVVVPVFNEEAVLPAFHQRLGAVLGDLGDDCEVLYVDDGSTDRSAAILAQLQAADRRVGVARFTRNFGKEQAMSAGLKLSRGAAVIVIDADLQDPPELIPQMLDAWIGGAEMVNMRRRSRAGESWLKRASASAFYRLINRLSEVPIPARRRRLPPARPAGGRCPLRAAGRQSLHEGTVRLGRFPPGRYRL